MLQKTLQSQIMNQVNDFPLLVGILLIWQTEQKAHSGICRCGLCCTHTIAVRTIEEGSHEQAKINIGTHFGV